MPGRAEDQPCIATAKRAGGEGMRILTVCLLLSLPPLFGACQGVLPRPPEVIVENGNSGGSVLATSPDSRWVASGGWSGWVRVWALENGAAHAAWRAHNDSVNGVLFSQDGTRVLTAGYDGRMALWTIGGRLIDQWPTGSPVTGFAAASGADRVVTGHDDGSVRLWRTDGTPLETWSQVHGGRVRAVALDADGSSISAAGTDGQVTFWKTGDTPRRLEAPPSDARALLFDPQGTRLIGAGWFELFRWELPGGKRSRIPPRRSRGQYQPTDGQLGTAARSPVGQDPRTPAASRPLWSSRRTLPRRPLPGDDERRCNGADLAPGAIALGRAHALISRRCSSR